MSLCRTLIAAVLPLLMASEAAAQASAEDEDRVGTGRARQVAGPSAPGPVTRDAPFIPVPALDRERFAEAPSNAVGSVPIADNLDLRIGLLKVSRARRREVSLSQSHPMRDAGGGHGRIAAAGLRFSF